MKVFLASVVGVLVIAFGSQFILTHFVGESSQAAYSDRSARP